MTETSQLLPKLSCDGRPKKGCATDEGAFTFSKQLGAEIMRLDSMGVVARFMAKTLLPSVIYFSVFAMLISVFLVGLVVFGGVGAIRAFGFATETSAETTAALVFGGGLALLYYHLNSYYKGYTDLNFSQEKQIIKIRDILGRVESSLIIYAGEFNSSVYGDPRIIDELERIPRNCEIKLYFEEEEVDKRSLSFLNYCRSRDILPMKVPRTNQGHFAIVDRRHVRLEFSRSNHDSAQYAAYHYWRPDFADHVLEKFRENILKSDANFTSRNLPQ